MTGATILDIIDDDQILGPYFSGPSWDRWRAILKATFGLPLSRKDRILFHEVAGDRVPPKRPVRELVAVVGRGGGKDAAASAIATFLGATADTSRLRPGERGVILCLACDREQAAIALGYVKGYFAQVPLLEAMVERVKDDGIDLNNGVTITVSTSNFRAPRGRTVICAIFDEVSFFRSLESTSPDIEVDAAVAPGLARWPGSLKILISSAYRRTGLLYERYKAAYGQDDPDTLAVLGTSLQFNPTLDPKIIDAELAKDRERASAEYLSVWRDDLSSYISRQIVEELIDTGVVERAPETGNHYIAFTDEAGGSGSDASTLAIVHADKERRIIQDLIRVWKPPFSPLNVAAQKAAILKTYRINKLTGDHWAGGLPPDLYRQHGIRFEPSARAKSDLYIDFLNVLNSKRIRLLDHEQTITELLNLERRVRWGGRESIDHPAGPAYHDDCVNSVAGAAVLASIARPAPWKRLTDDPEFMAKSAIPNYCRPSRNGGRMPTFISPIRPPN
jgi:hypothetical protein